jgi:hypothetical protein
MYHARSPFEGANGLFSNASEHVSGASHHDPAKAVACLRYPAEFRSIRRREFLGSLGAMALSSPLAGRAQRQPQVDGSPDGEG